MTQRPTCNPRNRGRSATPRPAPHRRNAHVIEALEDRVLLAITPGQFLRAPAISAPPPVPSILTAPPAFAQPEAAAIERALATKHESERMAASTAAVETAYLPAGVSRAELAMHLEDRSPAPTAAPLLQPNLVPAVAVNESEPNNTRFSADPVPLGFGIGQHVAVEISGSVGVAPALTPIATSEDDGSIPSANPTGMTSGMTVVASGVIGDGPFGATSGDYDFYQVAGALGGDLITVDVDSFALGGSLDSVVIVYDAAGNPWAANDDFGGLDSYLEFPVPFDGDFYVAVLGYFSGFLADPFDSSSGGGAASVGQYQVQIGLNAKTPPSSFIPVAEDDGAIPLANPTGLVSGASVTAFAAIGDGPFGGTSGDYDFYQVPGVAAGDVITVDINAADIGSGLDSVVGIYDSAGNLLTANNDATNFDSYLDFTAPYADDFYVAVRGIGYGFQSDPFDSSSGTGAVSTGFYFVTIARNPGDVDYYRLELAAGDILGANVFGGADTLSLLDASGQELIGSRRGYPVIYPTASPLSGAGRAALSWVIDTSGTYFVRASGALTRGNYELDLHVYRPALEAQPIGTRQILYLDFDGAALDTSIFYGGGGPAVLSPLASFLPGWGLSGGDEDAVIDAIVAVVAENLSDDLRAQGNNGDYSASGVPGQFDIEIRNSRDHADPWGQPHVSRVIIGGSIPELGIPTIGVAQSIDVGNFDTSETAVVLLDILSAPADDPDSLNQFARAPGATIFDLIGTGVGNIVAHEAGHFLGNWHTDQFNGLQNADLMDQGGFLANTIGVGPDFVFGSADDIDVDFGRDAFVPNEGFWGVQNTLNALSFGLSTGTLDVTPPQVTSVSVSSPAWSSSFRNYLQTHGLGSDGYAIPVGDGDQLDPLPWVNLRQIRISFSEDVVVANDDLLVSGSQSASYTLLPSGFTYHAPSHTATWTLAANLPADKLLLSLDSGPAGIRDAAGNALDGEWDNPTSTSDRSSDTFPSGNGLAGGDFHFRLNVLPGDTNGNQRVQLTDVAQTLAKIGVKTTSSRYNPRNDVDGSGTITTSDMLAVLVRVTDALPRRDPPKPSFPTHAAAIDAVFASTARRASAETSATALLIDDWLAPPLDELLGNVPQRSVGTADELGTGT